MSDTPETDKLAMTFGQVEMNLPESNFKLVPAYFARKLERERDEARRIAEDLHSMGVDGQGLPPIPWK